MGKLAGEAPDTSTMVTRSSAMISIVSAHMTSKTIESAPRDAPRAGSRRERGEKRDISQLSVPRSCNNTVRRTCGLSACALRLKRRALTGVDVRGRDGAGDDMLGDLVGAVHRGGGWLRFRWWWRKVCG